jgi:cytoskeletal protein RodZ
MTDIRATDDLKQSDEDRLPWLEAVEEEDRGDGPTAAKLIAFVVIGLVAIGLIVGGLFWLGNRGSEAGPGGEPELIAAADQPYKRRPDEAGGMKVDDKASTSLAASEGSDAKGNIDVTAVAEAPMVGGPKAPQQPATQPKQPAPAPAAPAPTQQQPAAPAAGGGATVQLGAFPNGAAAERAWKALSGRFAYLAPLTHSVVVANVNGKTYYRLRASGPGAAGICARLKVAGEQCLKV